MSVGYKDYYQILDIKRDASPEDIQKAYKTLARKYHPDLNQNDKNAENKFKDIGEAYEVLKDPKKRAQYDALGSSWKHGQNFSPPPGWQNYSTGHQNINFNMGDLGDINDMSDFFRTIFGGGFSQTPRSGFSQDPFRRKQPSQLVDLSIKLEQLFDTSPLPFTYRFMENGLMREKSLKVTIPKGAKNKTIIKLKNQGPDGSDLRLRLNILDTPLFKLEDYDINYKLKISPWEAALGTTIEITTLDNKHIKLTIPKGIQNTQKLRIPDKGLPKKQGFGDLFIEMEIVNPKNLTQKEKELFMELQKISKFNPRNE